MNRTRSRPLAAPRPVLRRRLGVLACAVAGTLGLATAGAAQSSIKIETRADGLKVIVNENPVQRARRHSHRLLPVPAEELAPILDEHCTRHGLDPRLVRAVIQTESGWNALAVSSKGAMGLMQLMPETASDLAVEDPFAPAENLAGGIRYLRSMLDRFDGRLDLALAAYNAGPTVVTRYAAVPPYPETRAYVERVLSLVEGRPVDLERRGVKPRLERDADGKLRMTTAAPRRR